jgi:hypothetical protein
VEKKAELDDLNSNGVDEGAILAEAQAELEQLNNGFPAAMDDVDVMEFLMNLADETNVEINVKASKPSGEELAGGYYMTVPASATVDGNYEDVLNFIDSLEDGEIKTIVINDCVIDGDGADWSASISFSLTSREASN